MNRSNSPRKKKRSTNDHDLNSDGRISVLEARFAQAQSVLNPRRRELVRAILDSAEETCFLSSRELAKRYRVDATTILRATQVLGYQSYSDFSADLRQHFVTGIDRKSTRLNSSHGYISYAVFCLKKKNRD